MNRPLAALLAGCAMFYCAGCATAPSVGALRDTVTSPLQHTAQQPAPRPAAPPVVAPAVVQPPPRATVEANNGVPIGPAPKAWPIAEAARKVSSPFGIRGRNYFHKGIDIKGPYGAPVHTTGCGAVTYSGTMRGYGHVVIVKHDGEVETRYAHLSARDVKVGEEVQAGDVIGRVGRSGNATTVHVHYEVRLAGKPVDPRPYLEHSPTPLARLGK